MDSVNLKQIIITNTTTDVYSPKVIRSTMGAIFRINIVETSDLVKTVEQIKKHKYKIMATAVEAEKTIYQVDYQKKAIIIGNEANGVSKEIIKRADETIKIPMLGKTESLNASVATGIILYEYTRQKQSC